MTNQPWRLLLDEPADGATNMARDEALLQLHAEGTTPPTIRLYGWQPTCLSLGRFQRGGDVRWDACAAAGVEVVRRPSGGRALLHAAELTYAIVARADHPVFAGRSTILHSYHSISSALLCGLQRLHIPAELAPVERRRGASAACFDTPAAFEITVAGRKLVGSAQARLGETLLQHGAIPLAPHAAQLAALLHTPIPDLHEKMITLDAAAGRTVGFGEALAAIQAGFADAWNITLHPGTLHPAERARAENLRRTRYTADAWTHAR